MANSLATLPSDPRWTRAVDLARPVADTGHEPLQIPALSRIFLNGLTRGVLVEASGGRSSGKSSLCVHILARATQNGEICAVIDLYDSFHPDSAAASGVQLERLLWVRCQRNPEFTMKAADLLLHAGGFGVVLLDLSEAKAHILNRIPISYWYRFQRAIQNTPTILLICADAPQAKAASRHALACQMKSFSWFGQRPFTLLRGINAIARQRKPAALRPEDLQISVA